MLSPAPSPPAWSPEFCTRPEILGTFGVVASTHWLASGVAMAVLERGGNAFDAACAAGFTLQVVEPHLNGPGGDCPIILHSAATGTQEVICGQGVAPAAASIAHFEQLDLDLVPGTGLLPAVVPGSFDAWLTMLERHGSWRLADVLAFAIGYAERGFPLVPRISATISRIAPLFTAEWPSSAATFLPGGTVPAPGSLFRNPDLAATYARILRESSGGSREQEIARARALWYQGFVAEAVGRFYESELIDTSNRRHRGLLTAQDFAEWRATIEAPLAYDYGRHRLLKCGPWSQGGAFLQTLALLKGLDLAAMDPVGADFVHTVVEAQKLAFADREAFYGDPTFATVPMDVLLSDAYNAERRDLIGEAASHALRPGTIAGHAGWVDHEAALREAGNLANLGAGEPTVARLGAIGGDTCHVDVIDRLGNMVAATPSGGWLQSSPVVPGTGFPITTRGQMFWLKPGLPNSLAPRKRPRTTLSPALCLRDGRPWMAFGTPGGEQQDQWACAMFLRMVHHGLDIQQAIDAPGFHTEHWPSSFWPRSARPGRVVIESRFGEDVAEALRARGHALEVGPPWNEGRLSAARSEGGLLKAGANARGMQGYAVGR
jgi:gamma-glutamyltranspeptidase/glutathione hydrolase